MKWNAEMHLLKHLSQHLEDWKIQNRWHWHINWASPLLQQKNQNILISMAYFTTSIYLSILDTLLFKLWIIITIINKLFDLFIVCLVAPINYHTYLHTQIKCKPFLYLIVFKGLNPCNELEIAQQTTHRYHNQFSQSSHYHVITIRDGFKTIC